MSEMVPCRLCGKRMTLRAMQKHMGHHHEQLALFALPPNLDDTEEDHEEDLSSVSNNDDAGTEAASQSDSDMCSDPLSCPFAGCEAAFTGDYRRGNLGRHWRQKHTSQVAQYRCEDEECMKSFRRRDARLKHYRRYHPELAGGPWDRRRKDRK